MRCIEETITIFIENWQILIVFLDKFKKDFPNVVEVLGKLK